MTPASDTPEDDLCVNEENSHEYTAKQCTKRKKSTGSYVLLHLLPLHGFGSPTLVHR
jgi:hypothetical protein